MPAPPPGPLGGRPWTYTDEIATEICDRLAAGESLMRITRDAGMPHESTVRKWHIEDVSGFSALYTRAREMQAHRLADEMIEIADTPQIGETITTEDGGVVKVVRGDMVQHRRMRWDARRWYISKVLPKVYGDRIMNQALDKDGNPTDPVVPVLNLTVARE
jgi:hypothetical protein